MKQAHTSPASTPLSPRPHCRSGEHLWQASLTIGQLLCLRCGLLACCPLCQPVLPTPELVLVHCARHRLPARHSSSTVSSPQREVQL